MERRAKSPSSRKQRPILKVDFVQNRANSWQACKCGIQEKKGCVLEGIQCKKDRRHYTENAVKLSQPGRIAENLRHRDIAVKLDALPQTMPFKFL